MKIIELYPKPSYVKNKRKMDLDNDFEYPDSEKHFRRIILLLVVGAVLALVAVVAGLLFLSWVGVIK